jgi:hypothetical protein
VAENLKNLRFLLTVIGVYRNLNEGSVRPPDQAIRRA